MWSHQRQQQQQDRRCPEPGDKCAGSDSASGDSGFISGSCVSSTCSSLVAGDSASPSTPVDVSPGCLSDSFARLELARPDPPIRHNPRRGGDGKAAVDDQSMSVDSGIVSEGSVAEGGAGSQQPWELYYAQNDDGDTLLHAAIVQGFAEASLSLIEATPHPCLLNVLNDEAQTALHLAVITDQPVIARRLLLAGADRLARNYQGNTALHLACLAGNEACARALTERGGGEDDGAIGEPVARNLEQRNYLGQTCLHVAVINGHVDIVRLLLDSGADLEARELLAGRTALHLALEHGRAEVLDHLLQERRPNLDAATYSGLTARELAGCLDEHLPTGKRPADDEPTLAGPAAARGCLRAPPGAPGFAGALSAAQASA